jgi:hypothetical protein
VVLKKIAGFFTRVSALAMFAAAALCTAAAAGGTLPSSLWLSCGLSGQLPCIADGIVIVDPMPGKPAFWVRGSASGAVVTLASGAGCAGVAGATPTDFQVRLRQANGPFPVEAELQVAEVEIFEDTVRLAVRVPDVLPADVYALEVSAFCGPDTISGIRPNAVKIIENLQDSYTIVHVTDIHVGDPRGFLVNARESADNRPVRHMIRMVNLLNPELVIMTGDHVFGSAYQREYLRLYTLLQELEVPVFMSVGNHDAINQSGEQLPLAVDGVELFTRLFAPLTYAVDYGRLRYFSLNSMDWTDAQRRGLGILTLAIGGRMRAPQGFIIRRTRPVRERVRSDSGR